MMRGPVDERSEDHGYPEVAVVYGNRPHVNQNIHDKVGVFVHREEEYVDVVGTALEKTVYRVEGVTRKRGGYLEKTIKQELLNVHNVYWI